MQQSGMPFGMKVIVAVVAFFILVIILVSISPFTIIGAGEVGVVTRNGAVSRTLESGLHGITPIIESVHKIDIQTQKEQTDADAASSDLQKATATVAVNYNVEPSKAADLYARIGNDYKSKVIDPAIQEAVKSATANYTAEELITKRPEVTAEIKTSLAASLTSYDIAVSSVSIVNFAFSPSFEAAIEAKVTASQNAEAAKNKLAQVQYEAQQTEVQADAQAYTTRVQSEAANNAKYIQLKQLEVQKAFADKWDGKLPQNLYGSAPIPFLQLGGQQ